MFPPAPPSSWPSRPSLPLWALAPRSRYIGSEFSKAASNTGHCSQKLLQLCSDLTGAADSNWAINRIWERLFERTSAYLWDFGAGWHLPGQAAIRARVRGVG